MDAYSYRARGHVFANAQTGKVVLFGVRVAAGNWASAWKTLSPILASMCGVAVARLLGVPDRYIKMAKDTKFRAEVAERIGLGFELPKSETGEVVPNVPRTKETEVVVSV